MESAVKQKFETYPPEIRTRLMEVRETVFELCKDEDIGEITETLKWGEPAYMAANGSAVRIGWNSNRPDCYSVYFNCRTKLIDTFREIYGETFQFVGNREIVFSLKAAIPMAELKTCISMALRYHRIKHLPSLGV